MGYKELTIRIPVSGTIDLLKSEIQRRLRVRTFNYTIQRKSLDARNKRNIAWQYMVGITSDEIKTGEQPEIPMLNTSYRKRNKHIAIVGSGPAGIFPALYLAECGFKVTVIEQGSKVESRRKAINKFETTGTFSAQNNYAFGEGGAGTFSDGKLTSRTKSIKPERNYLFSKFIEFGAPAEISYMTHPHLGTDNLYRITKNARKKLESLEGEILFDSRLEELQITNHRLTGLKTTTGTIEADFFILATGHSAYETYRMLIRNGIPFHPKNFAIGFRIEHAQDIINLAQWGTQKLPGVKAAEYRLTAQTPSNIPVYSFCMCPGGKVVPATPYAHTNIVNGMSYYQRDSTYANAAVVAGINLNQHLNKEVSAMEALAWLEQLENSFFTITNSYNAPACTITDFLSNKSGSNLPPSSYPFEIFNVDYKELLPKKIITPLQHGLNSFCKKMKGYELGIILGLETKTSAPIQVERDKDNLSSFYPNLFVAGEGSGWAGGITSSAADGLKIARHILAIVD